MLGVRVPVWDVGLVSDHLDNSRGARYDLALFTFGGIPMNAEEKKANRITRKEVIMIFGLVFTISLILLAGFAARVWANDAVIRGSQSGEILVDNTPGSPAVTARVWGIPGESDGVQVVRGYSNYPVYEIRESPKPEANQARQFFGEWDNWRRRLNNCRVNPNGRGRRGC